MLSNIGNLLGLDISLVLGVGLPFVATDSNHTAKHTLQGDHGLGESTTRQDFRPGTRCIHSLSNMDQSIKGGR